MARLEESSFRYSFSHTRILTILILADSHTRILETRILTPQEDQIT